VTVSGITGRDVVDISMDHDLLSVDFGFDGTEAQFPMSRVQRLSVQLGAGDDGLRVIDTGVSDVPITIGAIHKVIPLLERTIGPPLPLESPIASGISCETAAPLHEPGDQS
jgi:hypothetical protein